MRHDLLSSRARQHEWRAVVPHPFLLRCRRPTDAAAVKPRDASSKSGRDKSRDDSSSSSSSSRSEDKPVQSISGLGFYGTGASSGRGSTNARGSTYGTTKSSGGHGTSAAAAGGSSAAAAAAAAAESRFDNLRFYQNEIKSHSDGDYIEAIHSRWFGQYDKLEKHHSYIQAKSPPPPPPPPPSVAVRSAEPPPPWAVSAVALSGLRECRDESPRQAVAGTAPPPPADTQLLHTGAASLLSNCQRPPCAGRPTCRRRHGDPCLLTIALAAPPAEGGGGADAGVSRDRPSSGPVSPCTHPYLSDANSVRTLQSITRCTVATQVRSYRMMLDFYGARLVDEATGKLEVCTAPS